MHRKRRRKKIIKVIFLVLFLCLLTVPSAFALYRETATKILNISINSPSYTVTFNYDDGVTASTTKSVTYNHSYGTLPSPTRVGYTFNGWYLSSTRITSSSTVTTASNHTLVAKWTANRYTITLDNQSATTAGTGTIYEKYETGYYLDSSLNNKMTASSNGITIPSKTGYLFKGYYTGTDGSGTKYIDENGKITSSASTTNFTAAGRLYAYWVRVMAENISYDNTNTGFNCDNAQCMINFLWYITSY